MTDIINDDDTLHDTIDFAALAEGLATESGIDMTKAETGGGARPIPAAGPCRLRFVGYIELGKQPRKSMGKEKIKDTALMIFEVSGPKHPPIEGSDGTKRPHLIYVELPFSRNEKANIMKWFARMNYAGKARHIVGLLGEAFKGTIYHRKFKYADGKEGVSAELSSKEHGISIDAPRVEDPESGELIPLSVAPPMTPIKCFVWEKPSMAMWKSIFIDGEWEERKDETGKVTKPAKSKNVYQNMIREAKNFEGSPIANLLAGAGVQAELPKAESGKDEVAGADDKDPLAGVA